MVSARHVYRMQNSWNARLEVADAGWLSMIPRYHSLRGLLKDSDEYVIKAYALTDKRYYDDMFKTEKGKRRVTVPLFRMRLRADRIIRDRLEQGRVEELPYEFWVTAIHIMDWDESKFALENMPIPHLFRFVEEVPHTMVNGVGDDEWAVYAKRLNITPSWLKELYG